MNTQTQKLNTPTPDFEHSSDDEIALMDIVDFLMSHWLRLLMGVATGLFIAIGWWGFYAPYKAEIILNQSNLNTKGGLNFLTWRSISKNLPNLAAEMLQKGVVSNEETSLFEAMKNEKWLDKQGLAT